MLGEISRLIRNVDSDDLFKAVEARRELQRTVRELLRQTVTDECQPVGETEILLSALNSSCPAAVWDQVAQTLHEFPNDSIDPTPHVMAIATSAFRTTCDGEETVGNASARCLSTLFDKVPEKRLPSCVSSPVTSGVLRLFEQNRSRRMVRELADSTSVPAFVFDSFVTIDDLLLLANLCDAAGTILRFSEACPQAVMNRFAQLLSMDCRSLEFAFAARGLSAAVAEHEVNGRRFGAMMHTAVINNATPQVEPLVWCDLVSACGSTKSLRAVVKEVPVVKLLERLLKTGATMDGRVAAIQALHVFVASSDWSDETVAAPPALLIMDSVWPLRTSPDVPVRVAVWRLLSEAVRHDVFVAAAGLTIASHLVGLNEENKHVREEQAAVASVLLTWEALEPLHERIRGMLSRNGRNSAMSVDVQ